MDFSAASAWADFRPIPTPYQDGYVLLLWDSEATDEIRLRMIRETKDQGVKHVAIPVFGCQSSLRSSDVDGCEVQSREHPFRTAALAAKEGLTVTFLPILTTKTWEWRGYMKPDDRDAWFRAYGAWMRELIRRMRAIGMGHMELSLGTELNQLYREEAPWKILLAELRAETSQPLFLSVNWDDLNHGFWGDSDAIGVSAYFPLSRRSQTSRAELDQAWTRKKSELLKLSKQTGRPLYFTEFGYKSATGAARMPWDAGGSTTPDPAQQALCFGAFQTHWAHEKNLVRFHVWGRESPQDPQQAGFDPVGNPAESILRAIFLVRNALLP